MAQRSRLAHAMGLSRYSATSRPVKPVAPKTIRSKALSMAHRRTLCRPARPVAILLSPMAAAAPAGRTMAGAAGPAGRRAAVAASR